MSDQIFDAIEPHVPGPLTLERTKQLVHEFCKIYPVAYAIKFKIRATQEELYGPQASRNRVGLISGGYVPATAADRAVSSIYRGRCDLAYSSFRDEADLGRCLHHEIAGHFGLNTCESAEKQAVVDAILLSRQQPGIDALWERVVRNYADQSDLVRAKELYCTLAEELATFPAEVFEAAQTLDELGRNGPRIVQIDELRGIVAHVATGLHENTRDQVIFPVDRWAQFSISPAQQLTLERTKQLVHEFCKIYPVAYAIKFKIRATQEELYGPNATRANIGTVFGAYVPATEADRRVSPVYRGRCDLAYSVLGGDEDLRKTLRHEIIGHFGLNTLSADDKRGVLESIALSQGRDGIAQKWAQARRDYGAQPDLLIAEEVFCLYAENLDNLLPSVVQPPAALERIKSSGAQALDAQDVNIIAAHIATGLHNRTRNQVIFPIDRRAQFSRTASDKADKTPFHEVVANELIRQIEAGTAPWQKPWSAEGALGGLPTNPVSGKRYRGINAIHLMAQGRSDPRWLTYKQAVSLGAQVKKGERGTSIQYWKFEDTRIKTDATGGQPVLGPNGQPEQERYRLPNPRVFYATVFNAEQIDGLAPWTVPEIQWNPVERAEFILAQSGASLLHSPSDRAFYSLARDEIHLPLRSQFPSPAAYYATALHELGHWSGHETRLNRDLRHPFGSEGYAREELRAEIASMILGAELGLGHDPSRHASYVASWVSALQKDPLEIFRAAADAEKIHGFVMGLAQTLDQGQPLSLTQTPDPAPGAAPGQTPAQTLVRDSDPLDFQANPRPVRPAASQESSMATSPSRSLRPLSEDDVRDALSYISSNLARDEWARIGMAIKSEFPGEAGLALFDQWSATGEGYTPASVLSTWKSIRADGPVSIGTLLKQAKDNGYTPRVPLDSLQTRRQLDDPQAAAQRAADAAAQVQVRLNQQETAAVQALALWDQATPGASAAYLERKAVQAHGTRTTEQGTLLVPMVDQEGHLWNVQRVLPRKLPTGVDKLFLKGGRKSGLFHVIGEISANQPLVMAEGYATAASVYEATGWPCVVCFDAGNLVKVTEQFKQRFPDALLVVAGDDDLPTLAKKGKNPGREKATLAAQKASAALAFPLGLNPDQSDFNDLVASLGTEAGSQQIRASFEAALQACVNSPQTQNQALAIKALNELASLSTATPQDLVAQDAPEVRPKPPVQATGLERAKAMEPTGASITSEQAPVRFEVHSVGEFTQEQIGEFGQLSSAVYFAAGQDDAQSLKILRNGTLLTSPQLSAYLEAMVLERTSPLTSPGPQRLEELYAAALSNQGPAPSTARAHLDETGTVQPSSETALAGASGAAIADPSSPPSPPSSQATAPTPAIDTLQRPDPYNDLDLQALNAKRVADAQRTRQEMGQANGGLGAASNTSTPPSINSIAGDGPAQEPGQGTHLYQELRALRERLAKEYQHDGQGKYYFREGKQDLAFEDLGAKVNTAHHAPEVVGSMAQLAHAKGWRELTVAGSPEFRREMWLQASLLNMKVIGYEPQPIDLVRLAERRQLLAGDQNQKPGQQPNSVSSALAPDLKSENTPEPSHAAPKVATAATPAPLSGQAAKQLDAQLRDLLTQNGATETQAVEATMAKLYAQVQSPRVYLGKLLEHGPAPYKFDPNEQDSYFVKLQTKTGVQTIWGVDLPRALSEMPSSDGGIGQDILLAFQGVKKVQALVTHKDKADQSVKEEWELVDRNTWFAQPVLQAYAQSQRELASSPSVSLAGPMSTAVAENLPPPAAPAMPVITQVMKPLESNADRLRSALLRMGAQPLEAEVTVASFKPLLDSPKFQVGKLLEHGQAPYANVKGNPLSYYMNLATEQGPVMLWGADFPRAMNRNPVQVGQDIVVAYRGMESVTDSAGKTQPRNDWLVAPLRGVHEDAQDGVIQTAAVSPKQSTTPSVQSYPSNTLPRDRQLLGILADAMQLAGIPAELAAGALSDARQHLQQGTNPAHASQAMLAAQRPSPAATPVKPAPLRKVGPSI
jgi:antirestriction protein ArdC/phage/plasmid primase-like uncharacterized protein